MRDAARHLGRRWHRRGPRRRDQRPASSTPPTPEGFARALVSLRDDPGLVERLAAGARAAAADWQFVGRRRPARGSLPRGGGDTGEAGRGVRRQGRHPAGVDTGVGAQVDVLARHLDTTIVSPAGPGPRSQQGVVLRRFPSFRPAAARQHLLLRRRVGPGGRARRPARRGRRVPEPVRGGGAPRVPKRVLPGASPGPARPRGPRRLGDRGPPVREPVRRLLGPASDRVAAVGGAPRRPGARGGLVHRRARARRPGTGRRRPVHDLQRLASLPRDRAAARAARTARRLRRCARAVQGA